ncbi:uncharacterized protein METZ01_LOCUS504227, partial [marine metagenome]
WIRYQWDHLILSAERKYSNIFIPSDYTALDTFSYSVSMLGIGYNLDKFIGNIKLYKIGEVSGYGIKGNGDINISWFNLNQQFGFYKSFNNLEKYPLEMYSLANIILSPNIWPWRSSRYQPFIGMESVYIQHSGKQIINTENTYFFSELESSPYSFHLINMEFGILLKGFKVSYRLVHILDGVINNTSNNKDIPSNSHLEVVWQFIN